MSEVPKTCNQAEMQRLFEDDGWRRTKGGKHVVKMQKDGHRPVTLPWHRGQQYSKNLTARILKQGGIV